MKKLFFTFGSLLSILPVTAFAATTVYFTGVTGWVISLTDIVSTLIPFAFGLALLAFFWGVALYIFRAGDEKQTERGRRVMVGGIIGLFVISAIWGIVYFIAANLFGGNTGIGGSVYVPSINTGGTGGPGGGGPGIGG